jgi:hypothetical protein
MLSLVRVREMGVHVVVMRGVRERITVSSGGEVGRCMRVVIGMREQEMSMGRVVKWRREMIRPRGREMRMGCEVWGLRRRTSVIGRKGVLDISTGRARRRGMGSHYLRRKRKGGG